MAAGRAISALVDWSDRLVLRERSGSVASDNHWQNDDVCNQRLAGRDRVQTIVADDLTPVILDRMASAESPFTDRCQHLVSILLWSCLGRS